MSSAIPPDPWFSTINFNESFFTSNTQTISLSYANATYLRRIGIATSVASLTTFNGDVGINGTLTTNGLIDASTANFSGQVNFNSLVSPPHCPLLPSNENDLCNKLYVDSQAALTAYQLYLNYSDTFTTPAPASVAYKTLSQTQVPTPSTFPFTISAIGNQLIAGFFNTLVAINVPLIIPAGVWTLLCFCNVNTIADQGHIGLLYTISRFDAAGAETVVYTSPVSALLSVVSPLVGTSSVSGTFPATTLAAGTTGIGLKLFIVSNTNATRTGNIFFQNAAEYTSILTSFAVQQAPDLLTLNNTWTGTNAFNNATSGALSSLNDAIFKGVRVGRGTMDTNSLLIGSGTIANTGTATGNTNIIIGNDTAKVMSTANGNTIIGYNSAPLLTSGNTNIIIGYDAGKNLTTGSLNTCIGSNSKCSATVNYSTAIGYNAEVTANNTIQLGTTGDAIKLGLGASVVTCPGSLSVTGNISCGGTIATTNATAANRAINNVNYNLIDISNTVNTVGTIYGNTAQFYLEHKVNSGSITLSVKNASGTPSSYGFDSSLLSCPAALSTVGNISYGGNLIMTSNNYITTSVADPNYNLSLNTIAGGGAIYLNPQGDTNMVLTDTSCLIYKPVNSTGKITVPSISLAPSAGLSADIIYDTVTTSQLNIVNNTSGGAMVFKVNNAGTMVSSLTLASNGNISMAADKNLNMGDGTLNGCKIIQSLSSVGATNGLTIQNPSNNSGHLTIQNLHSNSHILIKTAAGSSGDIKFQPVGVDAMTISELGLLNVSSAIQFNIGADITATITLPPVFKSIYFLATISASQMVSLPNPFNHAGKAIMFRRKIGTQPVSFNYDGSFVMVPYNGVVSTNFVQILSTQFSTSFNCDGTNWYQMVTQ